MSSDWPPKAYAAAAPPANTTFSQDFASHPGIMLQALLKNPTVLVGLGVVVLIGGYFLLKKKRR